MRAYVVVDECVDNPNDENQHIQQESLHDYKNTCCLSYTTFGWCRLYLGLYSVTTQTNVTTVVTGAVP